jgi:hypothetical protein
MPLPCDLRYQNNATKTFFFIWDSGCELQYRWFIFQDDDQKQRSLTTPKLGLVCATLTRSVCVCLFHSGLPSLCRHTQSYDWRWTDGKALFHCLSPLEQEKGTDRLRAAWIIALRFSKLCIRLVHRHRSIHCQENIRCIYSLRYDIPLRRELVQVMKENVEAAFENTREKMFFMRNRGQALQECRSIYRRHMVPQRTCRFTLQWCKKKNDVLVFVVLAIYCSWLHVVLLVRFSLYCRRERQHRLRECKHNVSVRRQ